MMCYPFLQLAKPIRTLSVATYTAESTATTTEGDVTTPASLTISPNSALTNVENGQKISFLITNSIPAAGATVPVTITVNGANVPVFDKYGNIVYGASLRNGIVFKSYYGTDGSGGTSHIIIVNYPFRIYYY